MSDSNRVVDLSKRVAEKYKSDGIVPLIGGIFQHIGNNLNDTKKRRKKEIIKNYTDDKKYLNVGGGDFVWDNWRVLDYHTDWYNYSGIFIDYDLNLEKADKWPIDDDSFDLVFSSHTLEHLSDESVNTTLAESKRILKPGGTIRLNVPDIDIAERKYEKEDVDWFVERWGMVSPPSESKSSPYHMEEYLISFFATHLTDEQRSLDFEKVHDDYDNMKKIKFYQKYSNMIKDEWQEQKPGAHRNWFNYNRLDKLLQDNGFDSISQKRCEVSDHIDFTYEKFNKRPYMSLFVEATA